MMTIPSPSEAPLPTTSRSFWRSPWPFGLLGGLLLGAILLGWDAKFPLAQTHETCAVIATGKRVGRLLKTLPSAPTMIGQPGPAIYDLALTCPQQGVVLLNDPDAFRYSVIGAGMPATLTVREYRFWPDQRRLQISGERL